MLNMVAQLSFKGILHCFFIVKCYSLNYDDLIHTSLVSVHALKGIVHFEINF